MDDMVNAHGLVIDGTVFAVFAVLSVPWTIVSDNCVYIHVQSVHRCIFFCSYTKGRTGRTPDEYISLTVSLIYIFSVFTLMLFDC